MFPCMETQHSYLRMPCLLCVAPRVVGSINWFGTKGAEIQIFSPRPNLQRDTSDFRHDPHSGVDDFVAAKTSEINEKDFDVGVCSYLLVLKEGNGHFLLFRGASEE
jgi:hypothetical protein